MPVQRTPWNRSFDAPQEAPSGPAGLVPDGPAGTSSPGQRPVGTSRHATPPVTSRVVPAPPLPDRRSRAGAAWVGIAVGVVLMVLLVVFLLQNTAPVEVAFFGLQGTAPLAVALLIAGIGFALVTLVVGTARIGQLRRRVSADARARRAASDPAPRS